MVDAVVTTLDGSSATVSEQAIADFTHAIQLNPQDFLAYQNRGLVYQTLGKQKEAEADFQKYKELTGTP